MGLRPQPRRWSGTSNVFRERREAEARRRNTNAFRCVGRVARSRDGRTPALTVYGACATVIFLREFSANAHLVCALRFLRGENHSFAAGSFFVRGRAE